MIAAEAIADSIGPTGARITTMILRYPRFVHAEMLTHRAFSRNASSSRAIPVERMIAAVEDAPARPVQWGRNQRGMQARGELSPYDAARAREVWDLAMGDAVRHARALAALGAHKQIVNRVLEPFAHITTLVTATEWDNFFALRVHPDAQPEMQALAYAMLGAYLASEPTQLKAGEWHIPFGDRMPDDAPLSARLKIATARCARVSYLTHDGEHDPARDIELHDQLAEAGHWSPFEHCAAATDDGGPAGNFTGWLQYRKWFRGECRTADIHALRAARPDWITDLP